MSGEPHAEFSRRAFIGLAGLAAGGAFSESALAASRGVVAIVADMDDPAVASRPVGWGIGRLRAALEAKGVAVDLGAGRTARHSVVIGRRQGAGPEDVLIGPGRRQGETVLSSGGARGLSYGLLELAERVEGSADPFVALRQDRPSAERPASIVRGILRAFCSKVEDSGWYYDKDGWSRYLDLLAASRFNRLQLAFGFGWDYPTGVTDDYFHFAYPYLVDVPGYQVRVEPLESGERERNLEILKFVARECGTRALDFQLGIWTHAYQWVDSPDAQHRVVGLTPQIHAAYCRDALALLLRECPDITGVTMRVHGESGIREGDYGFWRTVFQAITGCDRVFEIDMHAKGVNQTMIDMAAATGKAFKISPKYSAEHQGMGYHQADIRALEIPRQEEDRAGLFNQSNGPRRFTRYGYADLYQEGRKYDILYRRWPGTQRHTLNGDPAQAAAYGRTAHFCGAAGLEICEPLTFKGRNGSGHSWGRLAYMDQALTPRTGDWAKFAYSYRLWGRTLYDPDADPEAWRRALRGWFGAAAEPMERAMAEASRVLMILTTTHLSSASNRLSWFETYTNIPIVIGSMRPTQEDTPAPYRAATVSPLDPQLFSTAAEYVDEAIGGRRSPRYSPIEVAAWIDGCATASAAALAEARGRIADKSDPEFRRWQEDILIQIGLGRFFADHFRATVLYELYLRTGDVDAGGQAVARYQAARNAWAAMAERAATVYRPDISYGEPEYQRLSWAARIPDFDRDLAAMRDAVAVGTEAWAPKSATRHALVLAATSEAPRWAPACHHARPERFAPGAPLPLELQAPVEAVELHYRHVNQGERWRSMPMSRQGDVHRAVVPGDYTRSPYPLQYYFVLGGNGVAPVFFPAFNRTQSNQPYFDLWRRA